MKKHKLSSLLIWCAMAVALTLSLSVAKYLVTKHGEALSVITKEHDTYTYAVFDQATGALSIRRRPAVVSGNTLIDKDGTYDMTTIHALPEHSNGASIAVMDGSAVPAGARTDGWDMVRGGNAFEKTITSVVFDDKVSLQGDLSHLFYHFTSLETADLSKADFTHVNSMYEFFDGCSNLTNVKFDENSTTSNVTNMGKMFSLCTSLTNTSLPGLATDSVENMAEMFTGCSALETLDLSGFSTKNVKNMSSMFVNCTKLETLTWNKEKFLTESVTTMAGMFNRCSELTAVDISNFNTENVTDMSYMFSNARGLETLDFSSFNTKNVVSMSNMFFDAKGLKTLDLSSFTTPNLKDMGRMFGGCNALKSIDVTHFDTSSVTNMWAVFLYCNSLQSLDVSGFETSSVTSMGDMFMGCNLLETIDVSKFDTSNVTNMSNMFSGCQRVTELAVSKFDTSKVTNMGGMFAGCKFNLKTLDLSNFDTQNVTSMGTMFQDSQNLKTIYVSDKFVVNEGTNTGNMFYCCYGIKGGMGTFYDTNNGGTYAIIDGMGGQPGYFTGIVQPIIDTDTLPDVVWNFTGADDDFLLGGKGAIIKLSNDDDGTLFNGKVILTSSLSGVNNWEATVSYGDLLIPGDFMEKYETITISAAAPAYRIVFGDEDAEWLPDDVTSDNATVEIPADCVPTHTDESYVFLGWHTAETVTDFAEIEYKWVGDGFSKDFTFSGEQTEVTLYAIWSNQTITFTFNDNAELSGNTYTAVEGMTWGAWVNSTFNTTDPEIQVGQVAGYGKNVIFWESFGESVVVTADEERPTTKNDMIIGNHEYNVLAGNAT